MLKIKRAKIKKILAVLVIITLSFALFAITAGAADPGGGGGAGGGGGGGSEGAYEEVVQFFLTWFTRIGMLVGLVGAIMFGFAIKNNDAEQKQTGLLTMVAGFVVAAIVGAADMFNLFA